MDFAKNILAENWPDWEIVGDRELGKGSFGKVYKIKREYGINRVQFAALKVIRFSDTMDDSVIEEMTKEIELMTELKGNSNIVSYEDHKIIKDTDGSGYVILIRMELLTPFLEYIKTNGIDNRGVAKLGIDICKALELCHKKKIIHRDIKPQNIFISENGDFKLGDFGIARNFNLTQEAMTVAGSVPYMAPEVIKYEPYGKRADIYSLGTVLYELLNHGRKPYYPSAKPTEKEVGAAIRKKLMGEKLDAPCASDSVLSAIVLKACEFDSKKRFPSATEMRNELEKWAPPEQQKPTKQPEPKKQTVPTKRLEFPKPFFREMLVENVKTVSSKIKPDNIERIGKIFASIVLIFIILIGSVSAFNTFYHNDWAKAYESELQKLLDQNISFSSVFVGKINDGEAPVVAVSEIGGDSSPVPHYVLTYKNDKLTVLDTRDYDIAWIAGGRTKQDVLFVKGTDFVVMRHFGESEDPNYAAQQIIFGIENGAYVELANTSLFDLSDLYPSATLKQVHTECEKQMDEILAEYIDGEIEFVSYSENNTNENAIDYLNDTLDINLEKDILFDIYREYEDTIDEYLYENRNNPYANQISFVVMDLNGDEIPELIVESPPRTVTSGIDFYSYDSNGVVNIGTPSLGNSFFNLFYDAVPGDGKINAVYIGREKILECEYDVSDNTLKEKKVVDYKDITDEDRDEEGRIKIDYPNKVDMINVSDKHAYFEKLIENRIESAVTGIQNNESVYEDYRKKIQAMLDQGLEIKDVYVDRTQYDYPLVAVSFDDGYSLPNYIITKNQNGEMVVFDCNDFEFVVTSRFSYDIWFVYGYDCFAYVKTANESDSFSPQNNIIEIYKLSSDGNGFSLVGSHKVDYEVPEGKTLKDEAVFNAAKESVRTQMEELLFDKTVGDRINRWSDLTPHDESHVEYLEKELYIELTPRSEDEIEKITSLSDTVTTTSRTTQRVFVVQTDGEKLDARMLPYEKSGIAVQIPDGSYIYATEIGLGWAHVKYGEKTGWVEVKYLVDPRDTNNNANS